MIDGNPIDALTSLNSTQNTNAQVYASAGKPPMSSSKKESSKIKSESVKAIKSPTSSRASSRRSDRGVKLQPIENPPTVGD